MGLGTKLAVGGIAVVGIAAMGTGLYAALSPVFNVVAEHVGPAQAIGVAIGAGAGAAVGAAGSFIFGGGINSILSAGAVPLPGFLKQMLICGALGGLGGYYVAPEPAQANPIPVISVPAPQVLKK